MTGLEAMTLHGIGDFLLQNGWIAANKLSNWKVRAVHVAAYTLPFVIWLWVIGSHSVIIFGLLLALSHYIIDSRRWIVSDWEAGTIISDQVLHFIALAVLIRVLGV